MNNHSYIRWYSQYVYLTENKQLLYLSYTVRLKTFEYKHMQRKQKTIQRKYNGYIRLMYTVVFLFCLCICISCVCNRCINVCIHLWCVRGGAYVGY